MGIGSLTNRLVIDEYTRPILARRGDAPQRYSPLNRRAARGPAFGFAPIMTALGFSHCTVSGPPSLEEDIVDIGLQ